MMASLGISATLARTSRASFVSCRHSENIPRERKKQKAEHARLWPLNPVERVRW